jgi:hypothetical protein
MLDNQNDAKITDPFNYNTFNFQPAEGSPVFNASYWVVTPVIDFRTIQENSIVKNYPNPFSGITNIELKIKRSSYVDIEIINISGAVVSQIQNGDLFEGTHQFRFDATNLPAGLYFGKVRIENEVKTLKMIAR